MSFLADVAAWFGSAERWAGPDAIPVRLGEHLLISGAAVLVAAGVAIPLGVLIGHARRGGAAAVNAANAGRAIPSFAVLVFALQLFGLGAAPALAALVLLAVPPMLLNTYVALRDVDPDVRDAGRGMGMSGAQLLGTVELPLAVPLIMAGVRTATVQVIATAPLAALVAYGGLGRYIIDGILLRDFVRVFGGAVLVVAVSVLAELVFALLQRLVAPGRGAEVSDALAGATRGMGAAA